MSKNENELQQGPFEDTTTKTIVIKPIEITITQSRKSTHVPKPECGCGGGGGSPLDAFIDMAMKAVAMKDAAATAGGDHDDDHDDDATGGGFPGEGNPE